MAEVDDDQVAQFEALRASIRDELRKIKRAAIDGGYGAQLVSAAVFAAGTDAALPIVSPARQKAWLQEVIAMIEQHEQAGEGGPLIIGPVGHG